MMKKGLRELVFIVHDRGFEAIPKDIRRRGGGK